MYQCYLVNCINHKRGEYIEIENIVLQTLGKKMSKVEQYENFI